MRDPLKSYERFQKAIFDGAQEAAKDMEKPFVTYGRCRKHPHVVISNGMFDAPCNLCEAEMEYSMTKVDVMACCNFASFLDCCCSIAFRCPTHGDSHFGTHD